MLAAKTACTDPYNILSAAQVGFTAVQKQKSNTAKHVPAAAPTMQKGIPRAQAFTDQLYIMHIGSVYSTSILHL